MRYDRTHRLTANTRVDTLVRAFGGSTVPSRLTVSSCIWTLHAFIWVSYSPSGIVGQM